MYYITIGDAANTLKEYMAEYNCSYEEAWCSYMSSLYTENFDFHEVVDVAENGMVFSTGAVIDSIDVGQIAIRVFEPEGHPSDKYTKLKVNGDEDLLFYDEQSKKWAYDYFTGAILKSEWRIVDER